MSARRGEDLAVTLYADVHYYYGPPTAKPPHHRFDKGSYVYLFENAAQRRARVEVANNAGTADQDAFTGYLDSAGVNHSYDHTCLVTLTVDGHSNQQPSPNSQEWHLPTFDPRNENKYMYKLHTIDLYFWKKEDALQFVNAVRRVLPQHQITLKGEPSPLPAHYGDASPVVQQLENLAISDPSYQQRVSRQSSMLSHNSSQANSTGKASLPGPPPPISAVPQNQEASNFAPMAYNPAAPAAPESIKHREKTPPPEDGAGNPLAAAAAADQGQQYGHPGYAQSPHQHLLHGGIMSAPPQKTTFGSLGSPPPQQTSFQYGLASPLPQQTSFHHGLASPPPQQTSFHHASPPPNHNYFPGSIPTGNTQSSYAQPPPQTPSFAPPPTNPSPPNPTPNSANPPPPAYVPPPQQAAYPTSTPVSTPGIQAPALPHSATAPPGGFSNYNYQNAPNTAPLMSDYNIHAQVYRPTEGESAVKYNSKVAKPPRGKLEENAGRLEGKIGGFLKKVERKYL